MSRGAAVFYFSIRNAITRLHKTHSLRDIAISSVSTSISPSTQFNRFYCATAMSSSSALTSWAESRLSAPFQAEEDETYLKAFDDVFSQQCTITSNHSSMSRQDLRDQWMARRKGATSISVAWDNMMAVIDEGKSDATGVNLTGIVSGSLLITRSLKIRIRAGPAQRQTFIALSAKIDQDPSVDADENGDRRRIVSYQQTIVDKSPPIHFYTPPSAQQTSADEKRAV